jgi:hypothetical protein
MALNASAPAKTNPVNRFRNITLSPFFRIELRIVRPSRRSPGEGHLRLVDQLLEERPVMNHCLAQLFGVGLPARLPERNLVSRPVVLQNQRMIHGDIRRALLKVADRIAPRGHYIAQQLVRFRYSPGGAVNEARLDPAPGVYKARTIAGCERTHMEGLDSLRAPFQFGFRARNVAAFLHGAGVLSLAKLSAQPRGPALSMRKVRGDTCNYYHDGRNDQDQFCRA